MLLKWLSDRRVKKENQRKAAEAAAKQERYDEHRLIREKTEELLRDNLSLCRGVAGDALRIFPPDPLPGRGSMTKEIESKALEAVTRKVAAIIAEEIVTKGKFDFGTPEVFKPKYAALKHTYRDAYNFELAVIDRRG